MLIRPTSLTLVQIFFWILRMAARLVRLISIKTKEYEIAIMKVVYVLGWCWNECAVERTVGYWSCDISQPALLRFPFLREYCRINLQSLLARSLRVWFVNWFWCYGILCTYVRLNQPCEPKRQWRTAAQSTYVADSRSQAPIKACLCDEKPKHRKTCECTVDKHCWTTNPRP